MKNKKVLYIVIAIVCILLLSCLVFILLTKNNNKESNENKITGTPIEEVTIKNSEVKELYNYIGASLESNYVCVGYYYQNPYKNHELKDKISLVLINYASKYQKKIDDEFIKKISKDDQDIIKTGSEYYIEPKVVKEGLKLIFNLDVDKFDDSYIGWTYRSDANAFVQVMGGGSYPGDIVQQIIDYNETEDEINLTVVKAEILSSTETIYDDEVITQYAGIYRYINNNSLVIKNNTENFKFTDENVNKFPQLKYIFKKNKDGKYYVSDIVNLNFEEDYEECK